MQEEKKNEDHNLISEPGRFDQDLPKSSSFNSETTSEELLKMQNSRLNFYRLQRKSSLSYEVESQEPKFLQEESNEVRTASVSPEIIPNEVECIIQRSSPIPSPIQRDPISINSEDRSIKKADEAPLVDDEFDSDQTEWLESEDNDHLPNQNSEIVSSSPTALPAENSTFAPSITPSESTFNESAVSSMISVEKPLPELASSPVLSPSSAAKEIQEIPIPVPESHNQPILDDSVAIPFVSLDDAEALATSDLYEMKASQNRHLRDADHVTNEMILETQMLLRLFGIPFVCAPAEAEAQCAALELLGLVDGVVTDDSDIFLFGARNVFRNMFSQNKTVERYQVGEIQRELGIDRDKLIEMALLLGSDYTEGIHGIGIVNAIEIVNAFENLVEFREWIYSDQVAAPVADNDDERIVRLRKFQHAHRNIRRNWQVPREFPSDQVRQTYLEPLVDHSEETFSWSMPDLPNLKKFCSEYMQWDSSKTEGLLTPILNQLRGRSTQTTLEAFFGRGEKAATIRSKRIKRAVNDLISN